MEPITSEAKEKGNTQTKGYVSIRGTFSFTNVLPVEVTRLGLIRSFN